MKLKINFGKMLIFRVNVFCLFKVKKKCTKYFHRQAEVILKHRNRTSIQSFQKSYNNIFVCRLENLFSIKYNFLQSFLNSSLTMDRLC